MWPFFLEKRPTVLTKPRAALQVGHLPHQLSTLGELKIAQAEIYFSVAS